MRSQKEGEGEENDGSWEEGRKEAEEKVYRKLKAKGFSNEELSGILQIVPEDISKL